MFYQTHWLVPALATALGGTLLLALVYYYLYARYRQRYLAVWSCAWSVYAFRFVLELIEGLTGFSSGAAVAAQSVTLISSILLLSGTYGFLSKPLPRAWVAAGAVGMLWMLLATLLKADFLVLATPTALVTAAGYLWTGWVILHSREIQGTGKHLAGWAFVVWAMIKLPFPVFSMVDQWQEWWFLATAVLETSVAFGYLLMYFEGSRAELTHSEERLQTRALQQETVARLGQRALAGADLLELFNESVHTVGRILQVEYCEVLELLPLEDKLVMRATLPGIEDLIGQAVIDAGKGSQAGYTLQCREPVVMPDIYAETRFTPNYLMREHGIASGMSAVIEGRERPFGVLNASSTQRRLFTENDINFLKSVANVLAAAIERKQAENALHRSEQAAQKSALEESVMAEIGRIIGSTWNIEDVYDRFSKEARKIISFDRITITRILPEKASTQILYTSGSMVPGRGLKEEYPLAGTISEKVLVSKKGVAFAPSSEDELTRSFPTILPMWKAGFRSFLLVPLISRDNVIGALVLSSCAAGNYTPGDVALAESIASQISGTIAHARLFAEHRHMAEALRESEASLRSILRVAPIGIGVVRDRVLTQANDRICQMLGYAAEELTGQSTRVFYHTDEDFEWVGREKYGQIRAHGTGSVETRWRRKDGEIIDVLLNSTPLDPSDGSRGVIFTALDITGRKRAEQERLRLEDRLRQAQKMEAIGTLAGGIAHDFNNILAAIIGFAELARIASEGNSETTSNISDVLKASFRARDLVRQILTFSRQTESAFGPIRIHLIVKEAVRLLRASLPSTIQVRQDLASDGLVLGDPTQIHQVVMNLCTNAFHAMHERGGVLEVSLSEIRTSALPPPDHHALPPGPCLRLRVRDTGQGIDPGIIHRIFDPYFTTKEKGKGTGLGLAVVHGIVKSHKGAIQVSSQLGEGATFDVYFPLIRDDGALPKGVPEEAAAGGGERILFVDDEPAIEILGKRMLANLGYEVATCGNAIDALEVFRLDPSAFDLVITDMTMPQITGDRMALEMMSLRPDLPVIICTGFNELLTKERAQELGIRALLMKPFLKNEAATLIRQVLDQR